MIKEDNNDYVNDNKSIDNKIITEYKKMFTLLNLKLSFRNILNLF